MKQITLPVLGALGAQCAQDDTDRLAKAVAKENTKALTAQGCRKLSVTSLVAAFLMLASTANVVRAQSASNAGVDQLNHPASDAFQTAFDYVTTFYPLWFTYQQSRPSTPNQLIGPSGVTPLYQVVVAINVDTLYASAFMQLPSNNPAILTIPSTNVVYSVLVLDPYGNIFNFNTKKCAPTSPETWLPMNVSRPLHQAFNHCVTSCM